jgi:hypothetical protein
MSLIDGIVNKKTDLYKVLTVIGLALIVKGLSSRHGGR